MTFQEGIPARRFRPGRALVAWLAWVRDDFPQRGLIQMIQEGLLEIPGHDPEAISFARLAAVFRGVRNRFRPRPLPRSARQIPGGLGTSTAPIRSRLSTIDGEAESESGMHFERTDAGMCTAARAGSNHCSSCRRGRMTGQRECSSWRSSFLEKRARQASQLDNYASRILIGKIKEMRQFSAIGAKTASSINVRAWLAALPDEAWVGGQGPRGGCLHVAHVLAGGHSGRPHTFIIGLDDGRFPGAGLQDPILLDDERTGLSDALLTSGRELAKRLDLLARLLARLRGNVTLSYSCHNLVDDREMFPSSIVLSAFRILSGQRDGDQAALNRWLAPAESFAPDSAEKALTESEWWLWRMSGPEEVIDPRELGRFALSASWPRVCAGAANGKLGPNSPSSTAGSRSRAGARPDRRRGADGLGQQARNAGPVPAAVLFPLRARDRAARGAH